MQRITCVPFVLLGNSIGTIMTQLHREGPYSYNELSRDAFWLIQNLEQWRVDTIFDNALSSKVLAMNLAAKLQENTAPAFLEIHGTEELAVPQRTDLISAIQLFINNLFFDLNLAESYMITQKRDRNMNVLIYSAEQGLSASTIKYLSEAKDCVEDIKNAGRCLAFDLPTACGFHIFRAVEAVALMYFPLLDIPYPDKKKRSLGTYIHLLNGKSRNGQKDRTGALKVDDKITGMLGHLTKFYRNPLAHPELTLGGCRLTLHIFVDVGYERLA